MTLRRALVALLLCASVAGACKEEEDDYVPIVFTNKPTQPASDPPLLEPQRPSQPPPSQPPPPPPSQRVDDDPLNAGNTSFMRRRAQEVMRELVAALPAQQRRLMERVPLMVDDREGEVNAFAACIRGRALLAVTDGLMEMQARLARAKANDEIFGTTKFDQLVQLVAARRSLPSGFFDPSEDTDARKVKRQHELFDEELAFVLGHELAHHYLSHTGCVGSDAGNVTAADFGRVLSEGVPAFNQPNELGSDLYGTQNALNAGKTRGGYAWTEQGALLTLRFFLALRERRSGSVTFSFESTHPDPAVRIPVVEEAANSWRLTGGLSLPVLELPTIQ